MPWQEQSIMSQRAEFVHLATQGGSIRALCRRFRISPTTGYKWLARADADGAAGLTDRSRRPHTSPRQTDPGLETRIIGLRARHPTWGGRKLHHALVAQGISPVPAPSTITAILHRHERILPTAQASRRWQRFEHDAPNDLWQLDFMGHRALDRGRVHPLTLLDDHSRFLLGLTACPHERWSLVQAHLTTCFARYGLPTAILSDNGPPWGTSGAGGLTRLEVWLLRLGVDLWHGRAYHPQTQGKVERIHRTITADAFGTQAFATLAACQRALDAFRDDYNLNRPHAALEFAVPISRYRASPRPFPARLPPIDYGPDDAVRMVKRQGVLSFQNRLFFVGRGLGGLPVAVRPTTDPHRFTVHFCHRQIADLDLRYPDET